MILYFLILFQLFFIVGTYDGILIISNSKVPSVKKNDKGRDSDTHVLPIITLLVIVPITIDINSA